MDIQTVDSSGCVRQLTPEEYINKMEDYKVVGIRIVLREEPIIKNKC